jgi:signal transduction histidine kinase
MKKKLRNGWRFLVNRMSDNSMTKANRLSTPEKQTIEIDIQRQLLELDLDPEVIQQQVELWVIINLYKQGRINSSRAGELLDESRDFFLDKLDELGVLYVDTPEDGAAEIRSAPVVSMLAEDRATLAELNRELVRINRRLREANREIREADRLKSEFVATISHELRTPLNTIIGFAKFILNGGAGPLTDMQRTDLSAIYSSGQHLLDLVNDILDLSKIEAGKVTLNRELLDFHEIAAGIMSAAIALVDDKPIELKEEIAPDLPPINADRQRVRQIIWNLVSNATKFTDKGHIALRVRCVADNGTPHLLCAVEDTGIGIREEDISTVFEAFRQVDSSSARRAQGTGLGLPISRRLAELHGGRMWVESEEGRGSTFFFTLPLTDCNKHNAGGISGYEGDTPQ